MADEILTTEHHAQATNRDGDRRAPSSDLPTWERLSKQALYIDLQIDAGLAKMAADGEEDDGDPRPLMLQRANLKATLAVYYLLRSISDRLDQRD